MGDVNDFQNFDGHFENELETLAEADIAEADRTAIREFVQDKNSSLKVSSLLEYLRRNRLAAERLDKPLIEASKEDINALLFDFEHSDDYGRGGGGMSENTLRNYRKALRVFFQYLDRDWADDLEIGAPPKNEVSDENMLSQDDIEALVSAATHPRDIALIEFLADTGARASMAGTLRVRDVELDDERPHYTPNEQATGLKDAPQQPYPIVDAKAAMRSYLRYTHPQPENPDAAFFHRITGPNTDIEALDDADTAMTSTHVGRRLREISDKAGVDKPVNPHNFRHSAITRMYREGYTKQQIQHRVAWDLDTRMWSRYVHVTAEKMNEGIYEDAGLVDVNDDQEQTRRPCGNCREPIAPHHPYCPNCGEPTRPETRELFDSAQDDITEALAAADDADERELFAEFLRYLRENPDSLSSHELPSRDSSSD